MPDILEIQKAVSAEWMGARAVLNTYEWFNVNTLESITCPQVVVEIPQAEVKVQAWVQIHPETWPSTTVEWIIDYFRNEIAKD